MRNIQIDCKDESWKASEEEEENKKEKEKEKEVKTLSIIFTKQLRWSVRPGKLKRWAQVRMYIWV